MAHIVILKMYIPPIRIPTCQVARMTNKVALVAVVEGVEVKVEAMA